MEEELNEHDLEERLYAMLHHVDETAGNVTTNQDNGLHIVENAPRSTVRRYWRTSEPTTHYQKFNTPKEPTPLATHKQPEANQSTKPKEEKRDSPVAPVSLDLSIFQSPVPQNIKKTIEIIENDAEHQVLLESSDEDEVIEVALPPKPTITIESSDEDDLQIVNPDSPVKEQPLANTENKAPKNGERDVSASPVPSVVSSVSDEFIRGDCIALNISSRRPDNPSFDFSLHGSDLLVQNTPSKKKKKRKTKEAITSTPVAVLTPEKSKDECFATPKSKARNKKQKTSLYAVTEKSLPNADIYDSDSNQSTDNNKIQNYKVTKSSLPNADVYESDSNLSEIRETPMQSQSIEVDDSNSCTLPDKPHVNMDTSNKDSTNMDDTFETISFVDLTENEKFTTLDKIGDSTIEESIVMGNVSGFSDFDDYEDVNMFENGTSQFGSTKIPAILNEDLDFDNLKGKDKVSKRRKYSLTTLRVEMEKFYNESWGGENFNHREIQKSMSRDKNLWVIDPKDRMPSLSRKKLTCNYCNRVGHRDETCRLKPAVCYMCGAAGHVEPRCPRKICVNCGSPNQMYSTMCRNCSGWGAATCGECGQRGHPATHCPDLWRRYHNTIDNNSKQLERCQQTKKHFQLFCSGCTRRGHLVHSCRVTLPFSGLPINSPYVYFYRPLYPPTSQDDHVARNQKQILNKSFPQDSYNTANAPLRNERNKRQSKSPSVYETHVNKKRNVSTGDANEMRRNTKSPVNTPQRKMSVSKDTEEKKDQSKNTSVTKSQGNAEEKALNFIPICSTNHDKKGNIIQDNEVSDTSDVVTSARIYVTNDIIDKLKSEEGGQWLKGTTEENNVTVEAADINSFLSITGKLEDQEAFQTKLRDWVNANTNKENVQSNNDTTNQQKSGNDNSFNVISKKRHNLLRQLGKALESLKEDLGDPDALYKELTYLQNRHQRLLTQKVISPQQLSNNRGRINQMLKKLNMVLLGQAGLADGPQHVSELYSFQEKLMNSRQKKISPELQKEIGEHYSSIFSPAQRDDYIDLLKMYHGSKQPPLLKKKNKKAFKLNPKINKFRKAASTIPTQQTNNGNTVNNIMSEGKVAGNDNPQAMTKNLVFYHKRLLNARPSGSALKKTRMELVRKLHSFIASLFRKEKMSSKAMKKMRKAQEQAQLFLANV